MKEPKLCPFTREPCMREECELWTTRFDGLPGWATGACSVKGPLLVLAKGYPDE